ncbi:hypothetical protein AB0395_33345 [Streptosporangium sp. NPDC051023]|uniref:hypothetical protein n=1 Tax=Streptosporangium sp. NPDC051023 TaxID=3155410 RepID=UPI00344D9373
MADTNAAYLRQTLPILVTYTRQVVLAVDVDRLHSTAMDEGLPADQVAFLAAMRTFQRSLYGLQLDEEMLR